MTPPLLPPDIFAFLSARVLGQEDVLRKVSVALYKHINRLGTGNILLIGNSGTGKTTIMKAVRSFYASMEELTPFRSTTILNANILQGEQAGDVDVGRIFRNLETDARTRMGADLPAKELQTYLEHATVCIDELDKIAARIQGKVNASGIGIQQALLTILEGETISFDTAGSHVPMLLDTSGMLFLCAGAFEDMYDNVFKLISENGDERRFRESLDRDASGRISYTVDFSLKEYLKLSDLFAYGMGPQFISRFSDIAVLEDLQKPEMHNILVSAPDSPLKTAEAYFTAMGYELEITPEAREIIVTQALQNSRIGARSLRETLGRIIAPLEFHPDDASCLVQENGSKILRIEPSFVRERLEQGR
jgi:ATP-dependent Clp protease ATP-binding subunit ClpX